MKKLMIAAAAVATAAGAYATEGCCGVAATDQATCKANVYQVKMSLKTLTPKTVKKNGCTGYYFEQGTRTIDGYIWTCCDPCGNVLDEAGNPVAEDYQITLWEKAAKAGILNGVSMGAGAGAATMYTVTVTYTVDGVSYTETLPGTYAQAQVAQAANDYVAAIANATLTDKKATPVAAGTDTKFWEDTQLASNINSDTAPACRFGKNAEKVAVQFDVAGVGAQNSLNGNEGLYNFSAAGFGTFDKKSLAVKSVSGSVVGTLPSLDICGEYPDVAGICDDFETWCDYPSVQAMAVPAFGTWTAKYVKKMGPLGTAVPVYNR